MGAQNTDSAGQGRSFTSILVLWLTGVLGAAMTVLVISGLLLAVVSYFYTLPEPLISIPLVSQERHVQWAFNLAIIGGGGSSGIGLAALEIGSQYQNKSGAVKAAIGGDVEINADRLRSLLASGIEVDKQTYEVSSIDSCDKTGCFNQDVSGVETHVVAQQRLFGMVLEKREEVTGQYCHECHDRSGEEERDGGAGGAADTSVEEQYQTATN